MASQMVVGISTASILATIFRLLVSMEHLRLSIRAPPIAIYSILVNGVRIENDVV
jgi:hypothetical protein